MTAIDLGPGGWSRLIDDQRELDHLLRRDFPQVPIVLLGHRLGASLALASLLRYSCRVHAAILSTSSIPSRWRCRAARLLVLLEAWRQGPDDHSELLPYLPLGGFVQNLHATFDSGKANTYIAAPHNTVRSTHQRWLDRLGALAEIASRKAVARIDAELPLLVIGGRRDPLGADRRWRDLYRALCAAGLNSVELKRYPEARHELFPDSSRDEVIGDLLDWLAHLPARQPYCPLEENS